MDVCSLRHAPTFALRGDLTQVDDSEFIRVAKMSEKAFSGAMGAFGDVSRIEMLFFTSRGAFGRACGFGGYKFLNDPHKFYYLIM